MSSALKRRKAKYYIYHIPDATPPQQQQQQQGCIRLGNNALLCPGQIPGCVQLPTGFSLCKEQQQRQVFSI